MRFLADENLPASVVASLRAANHDTTWIRTDAPGSSDDEVLARARRESRILLTFDKDFGELVFRCGQGASCGVVLFRVPPASPDDIARLVVATLHTRTDWEGHFTVVDSDRVRMRELPTRAR